MEATPGLLIIVGCSMALTWRQPKKYRIAFVGTALYAALAESSLGGSQASTGLSDYSPMKSVAFGALVLSAILLASASIPLLSQPHIGFGMFSYGILASIAAFASHDPGLSILLVVRHLILAVAVAGLVASSLTSLRDLVFAVGGSHLLLAILFPTHLMVGVGQERLSGFLQVNTFALLVVLVLVSSVFVSKPSPRALAPALLVAPISLWLLWASGSRGAVLALLAGIFGGLLRGRTTALIGLAITSVFGPALSGLALDALQVLGGRFASEVGLSTLGGRVGLWEIILDKFDWSVQHALIGYGLGAFRNSHLATQIHFAFGNGGQAHNAALEAFVTLGLVGVSILGAVTVFILRSLRRTDRRTGALTFVLIASATSESGIFLSGALGSIYLAIFFNQVRRESASMIQEDRVSISDEAMPRAEPTRKPLLPCMTTQGGQ